ncbi:hypothetical protein JOB18_005016 [Solea senegalensis]|uniref:Uncharacterized protein n=1 Tax=Solea senegalensis TaxID=28829 RepID=A0AAV6SQA9_SOLSE|nr:hypothetical protein JOB18_005016 [Solea senegalensis]
MPSGKAALIFCWMESFIPFTIPFSIGERHISHATSPQCSAAVRQQIMNIAERLPPVVSLSMVLTSSSQTAVEHLFVHSIIVCGQVEKLEEEEPSALTEQQAAFTTVGANSFPVHVLHHQLSKLSILKPLKCIPKALITAPAFGGLILFDLEDGVIHYTQQHRIAKVQ